MGTNGLAIAVTAIFLTGLAACNPHGEYRMQPRQSVEVAKEVCEINALAEEHRTLTTRIGSIERGGPTEMRDESWTILMEKLQKYRAEIDATYRFVTSNCTSYNLCMQSHRYREMECVGSRNAWTDSQAKFNQLALDLAKLERPVHPEGPGSRRPPRGKCPSDCGTQPPAPRDCRAVKCDVQGAIFSTGCCYDGD